MHECEDAVKNAAPPAAAAAGVGSLDDGSPAPPRVEKADFSAFKFSSATPHQTNKWRQALEFIASD
eukprot:1045990-Rhodomonas_salina.1